MLFHSDCITVPITVPQTSQPKDEDVNVTTAEHGAGGVMAGLVGIIQNELQKLNILQQDGIISMESFQAKAQHLQEHGRLPEAGVGMTIRERHPFSIEDLRPGGPAAKAGVIKIGDEITKVDGCSLRESLTGEQVLMRQNLSALLGRAAGPRLCCWALPCDFHLCADTCLLHASSAAPPCARSLLTTHVPYH